MSDRPLVLVTGGAKRVGRAIARRFAQADCDLIITYNSSGEEARSARDEFSEFGTETRIEQLELDDLEQFESFHDRLAIDRLDVLVHNASIYFPTPLDKTSPGGAEKLYRVNALAPLLLTKALAPALRRSRLDTGGSVVCMCDMHALGRPRRDFAAYAMSKAALVEMVRSLARDLAPDVRVNGIAPGVIEWPDEGYESDRETQEKYLSRVPLDRAGTPEDAADLARFLCLDAGYITGEIVRLDGGRWLA